MPSTAKPKKSATSRSASSSNNRSAKNASGSSRTRSASSRGRSASPTSRASNGDGISKDVGTAGHGPIVDQARTGAGAVAKGAAAAAVATAVGAFAGRALISSRRRKRVLGVPLPRKRASVKSVAKQFSSLAEELEKKSLDVSKVSGRAKRAGEILS